MATLKTALRAGAIVAAAACGARTPLLVSEPFDAGSDASEAGDARADVLPGIDASKKDQFVPPSDCPDAGSTLIYLITQENDFYSFFPPTLAFKPIGPIACASADGGTPWSMGVDRKGTAYSVFNNGFLFQVSTLNAACKATSYVPSQLGWLTFGMGYASIPDGGEALFVTEANFTLPSKGLGTIDTNTLKLGIINPFSKQLERCELTGTGDGRLFAFCLKQLGAGALLAQIDPMNANVIGADNLNVGDSSNGFAFAFWGGDFWIFTGAGATTVTRYDPVAKKLTTETTLGKTVVGAGVSTCAPQ